MDQLAGKSKDKKGRPPGGSVQPLDGVLSAWIERHFRGETPNLIDVWPLDRQGNKLECLKQFPVKPNDDIRAERSVEIANEIVSECQQDCDAWERMRRYLVRIIDNRRGGLAMPVGTHQLRLEPRSFSPGVQKGDAAKEEEEEDVPVFQKMMIESVKLIHDHDKFEQDNQGKVVGDTMLLMKGALSDREKLIIDLFEQTKGLISEFRGMAREIAERKVEERAVSIDEANAAENRRDQAAKREHENLKADLIRATVLEIAKGVGQLLPGVGQMFMAQLTGQPPPAAPPLPGAPAAPMLPAAAGAPEEKAAVERFIAAAEAHRIDAGHSAADKLFGMDDDKTHAVIEPGVFSREQVAILAGVRGGALGIAALDALLPDSGRPEAITLIQVARAAAFLTEAMRADVDRILTLRKEKRGKPQ